MCCIMCWTFRSIRSRPVSLRSYSDTRTGLRLKCAAAFSTSIRAVQVRAGSSCRCALPAWTSRMPALRQRLLSLICARHDEDAKRALRPALPLPIRYLHVEQRRAERLAVRIERQRARDAAAKGLVQHKIERAECGQFVALDGSLHDIGEMCSHARGGDVLGKERVVAGL